jgi:hypothetical protein
MMLCLASRQPKSGTLDQYPGRSFVLSRLTYGPITPRQFQILTLPFIRHNNEMLLIFTQ